MFTKYLRYTLRLGFLMLMGMVALVHAQTEAEITLTRDNDSVTFIIPQLDGSVSLEGISIEVPDLSRGINARRGILLEDVPGFVGVTFQNVPTPLCLMLLRASSQPLAPLDCRQSLIFTQGLSDADIFWIDDNFGDLSIFVMRGDQQITVCAAGSSRCVFRLPAIVGPTAVPPSEGIANRAVELLRSGLYRDAASVATEYIQQQPNDTLGYLLRALAQVFDKSYAAARPDYDRTLTLDPNNYYAYIGRGKINLIEGHAQAAYDDFNRAVQLQLNNAQGYYLRGRAYRDMQVYDLAIQDFRSAQDRGMKASFIQAEIGFTQVQQDDLSAAEQSFDLALTIDSEQSLAYHGLSLVHRIQGNHQQAIDATTRAIELETWVEPALDVTPTPVPITVDNAISIFTIAINIDQGLDSAALFCDRGAVYLESAQYAEAVEDFERARSENNQAACAYAGLAVAYSLLDQRDSAIQNANAAFALQPEEAIVYNNIGIAYVNVADYNRAVTSFTLAGEWNPTEPIYHGNLGNAHLNLGENQQAAAAYQRAVDLGSDDPDVFYNQGQAYLNLMDDERAVVSFTGAIALKPDEARYYAARALAYLGQNAYQQAIADYDQAIGLGLNDAAAFYNRGVAYLNVPDYAQAEASFSEAIALDSGDTRYYTNRAIARLNLRNYQQAIADYDQAIALGLNDAAAYYNRGLAYMNLQDYAQAEASFTQAIALDSDDARYYTSRASAYLNQDNYQQALNDYDQAVALGADSAGLFNNRGVAKLNLNLYDGAAADFRLAIQRDSSAALYHLNLADSLLRGNPQNCDAVQPLRDYLQRVGAGSGQAAQASDTLAQLEQVCS